MSPRLPGLVLVGVLSLAGAGALAQVEADRRLDAAIERLRAALGPDTRLEIGGRRVDPVSGNATLTDVAIIEAAGRLTVPEVRLSEVDDTRIGRAELLRTTYLAAAGSRGEVARIVVAGLPIPPAGQRLDIGSLSMASLEIEAARMTDPAKGAMSLGRLVARDVTPQGLASGTLEGFEFRDAAADPQMMRLGRLELEGLALPMTNGQFDPLAFRATRIELASSELRDPSKNVSIALGRFTLQNWQPDRPAALALHGLRLTTPAGDMGAVTINLARFEASGVDAPNTLSAVMNNVQVPDPFPGTPQRAALEGLEAAWEGQSVLALARLVTEGALADGIARGAMTAEGLRVVPPPGRADWLNGLGYREIAGGIEMLATAPRAGGRMEVQPLRLSWEQAGTLTLGAQVEGTPGAPPAGEPVQPEATAAAFAAARLVGMTLTLRDQGLLGRFLALQARTQRMPEARLREQWAQMAMAMPLPGDRPPPRGPQRGAAPPPPPQPTGKGAAAPVPSGPPSKGSAGAPAPAQAQPQAPVDRIAPMRQALASFIRQPGTLEITMRPPQPLSFAEMGGLGALGPVAAADRLGLSVVAR